MIFGLFGKKKDTEEVLVGDVTHYFRKVKAAVIRLGKGGLSVGEEVLIRGKEEEFRQKVESMQIDHVPVEKAGKGKEVAIRVKRKAKVGSEVYILKEKV